MLYGVRGFLNRERPTNYVCNSAGADLRADCADVAHPGEVPRRPGPSARAAARVSAAQDPLKTQVCMQCSVDFASIPNEVAR